MTTGAYGVMFRRDFAPELLKGFAHAVEDGGFDELWVVEDLGFHGGFTQVAAALAATDRLTVGLGIAPAVVRNAAFTAMEIATTARMFPGRFHMGFGHGVDTWIEQVGATPSSWLTSLAEVTEATRQLVRGARVTMDGAHVRLDDVGLVHPAAHPPLVSFGVRGPRSMALAARVADGVILAECSGPRYVAQTRAVLGPSSRVTVFINATTNAAAARDEVDRRIAQGRFDSQMKVYEGSGVDLAREVLISGDPTTWRAQSQRWFDAGADSVVWVPLMTDPPSVLATYVAALASGAPRSGSIGAPT